MRIAYSPCVVGVDAYNTECPAACLIDGDEGHGAHIVDLGKSCDETMAELLDGNEERKPRIFQTG